MLNKKKLTALIITLVFATSLLPMTMMGATLKDIVAGDGIDTTRKVVFQVANKNFLDENEEKTMDVEPYLYSGRTMVPVRYFGEALGGVVFWDENTKDITLTLPNGSKFDVTKAVIIKNNRSFMPLNLMRTNLNMTVDWLGEKKLVVVYKDTLNINTNGQTVIWEADPTVDPVGAANPQKVGVWFQGKYYEGTLLEEDAVLLPSGLIIGHIPMSESVGDFIPGTGHKF